MSAEDRDAVVAKGCNACNAVRTVVDICTEVARVPDSGKTSGSLKIQSVSRGRDLVIKPLRRLDEKPHGASILMLDATPPTVEQIQNVLGCRVRVALDQLVARSPTAS